MTTSNLHPRQDPAPADRLRRRSFLKAAAAGAAAAASISGIPARAAAAPRPASPSRRGRARNIIFMVADGMSAGTLTLGDLFIRDRDGHASNWVSLWNQPGVRRAMVSTACADSLVTDSAAAGSAWGCGVHVGIGSLNVGLDGAQHMPIFVRARQAGKATGLVTTTRVTHATPASFIVNIPQRDLEDAIAEQMLERPVDVILGGGSKHFPDQLLSRHSDVNILRDRKDLLTRSDQGGRLLGLFSEAHMPFEIERPDTVPTLAEMTRAAINRLDNHPDGFILQVEGGRVDHAAHNNDAAAIVREQMEFDAAIAAVRTYAQQRDDTLVVITTDHGNANPGLTVYGPAARKGIEALAGAGRSFDWIIARLKKLEPGQELAAALPAIIKQATNIDLDTSSFSMAVASYKGERVAPFREQAFPSVLGGLLANTYGVSFISPHHTADHVECTAFGPGSELLPQFLDNIGLHELMVGVLDLAPGRALPGMEQRLRVSTVAPD